MTIKKHNVIKKLDQYACINPITINGEVITAIINGSISFSALKEIQDSIPGWEVSLSTKKSGAALVIKQKSSRISIHIIDDREAMYEAIMKRVFTVKPLFMHSAVDPAFHPMKRRGF